MRFIPARAPWPTVYLTICIIGLGALGFCGEAKAQYYATPDGCLTWNWAPSGGEATAYGYGVFVSLNGGPLEHADTVVAPTWRGCFEHGDVVLVGAMAWGSLGPPRGIGDLIISEMSVVSDPAVISPELGLDDGDLFGFSSFGVCTIEYPHALQPCATLFGRTLRADPVRVWVCEAPPASCGIEP